jgi:DNA topoisomerase-1
VTDGETNATLPKSADIASFTREDAEALIAARIAKGPSVKKGKKAPAKKAASKKSPAKKPVAKKAAAKKKATAAT